MSSMKDDIRDLFGHAIDEDIGASRRVDPPTTKRAARSFKPSRIQLLILRYLEPLREPRNGWEMSKALDMATITVVPRLCKLRRLEFIEIVCERPGPSNRGQDAYIITDRGRQALVEPTKVAS